MLEDIVNTCSSYISAMPNISGFANDFFNSPIYTALAPVRHFLGGLICRNAAEKLYQCATGKKEPLGILANPLVLYLFSASPDIDSLIGLEHRDVTHSFAYAAAVGLGAMAYAAMKKKKPSSMYFLLPFAAVASHIGVDLLIEGGDPMNPLWPLTSERNVQVHPNYEWIGHAFTALGLTYAWHYYGIGEKLKSAKDRVVALFRKS